VEEQFRFWERASRIKAEAEAKKAVRFISISREYGCAGFRIGDRLAAVLNSRQMEGLLPWTVYDRKLIDLVCSDHKLSRVLVESLGRRREHELSNYLAERFAGKPSNLDVFKKCAETIFQLTAHGRVIVIGRASALLTANIAGSFHLRVAVSFEWRVKQVAEDGTLAGRGSFFLLFDQ